MIRGVVGDILLWCNNRGDGRLFGDESGPTKNKIFWRVIRICLLTLKEKHLFQPLFRLDFSQIMYDTFSKKFSKILMCIHS